MVRCLVSTVLVMFGVSASLAAEAGGELKGVFIGDHVGCKSKDDLFSYYQAKQDGDRVEVGKLLAQRKCLTLAGRTYVPLRVGFVTAYVRVTYQGKDIKLWTRSAAVVDSPPPARETHFNF